MLGAKVGSGCRFRRASFVFMRQTIQTPKETRMLGVSTYSQEYIDACHAAVDAQLAAYADVTRAAGDAAAIAAFGPRFLNHMVLALDFYFCHRLRGKEGKDGNALNEVRVLANSITHGGAVLTVDKTIRLQAATSVLGLEYGDPIRLTSDDFARLTAAFFAELERRFL